jgi:hypothetical protein
MGREVRLETYTPQSDVNIMPPRVNRDSTPSIDDAMEERDATRISVGPSKPEEVAQPATSRKGA